MTLQQLEYIRAVDKYGHFGKAAESCGVTQPTLSLMIKKLEEELDTQIFDRDAHPVWATEVGRKIIDKAGVVLFNAKYSMIEPVMEELPTASRIDMLKKAA